MAEFFHLAGIFSSLKNIPRSPDESSQPATPESQTEGYYFCIPYTNNTNTCFVEISLDYSS